MSDSYIQAVEKNIDAAGERTDEITRLREENARLRAALKPFVPKTQVINAAIPDTRPIYVMVRAGELRAAVAALKEAGDEKTGV